MSRKIGNDPLKKLFLEAVLLDNSGQADLLEALPADQRQELQSLLHLDERASQAGLFESFQPVDTSGAVTTGRQLGAYQIESKLGEGGMGTVFRATQGKLQRTVAIKLLSAHRLAAKDVTRFEREMVAAGRVSHPNLVTAFDAGEADGHHYLAMELIEGFDLRKISQACSPIEVGAACELIRQAAVGLQYAHEHGMVHRDIKPSNLMLSKTGQVKLLDLGLVLLGSETENKDRTDTGYLLGSVDYMAAEQGTNSHNVDIRADIYSLGVTLFKLLTGSVLFSGSQMEKLAALATLAAPSIRPHRNDLPDDLVVIVDRMIRRDPAERFAEPQEVAIALAPFAEESELQNLLKTTADNVEDAENNLDSLKIAGKETDANSLRTVAELSLQDRQRAARPAEFPYPQPRSTIFNTRSKKWLIGTTSLGSLAALLMFFLPARKITVETPAGQIVVVTEGQETPITINSGVVLFKDPTDHEPVTVSVNEAGNQLTFRKAGFLVESRKVDLSSEAGQKISLRFETKNAPVPHSSLTQMQTLDWAFEHGLKRMNCLAGGEWFTDLTSTQKINNVKIRDLDRVDLEHNEYTIEILTRLLASASIRLLHLEGQEPLNDRLIRKLESIPLEGLFVYCPFKDDDLAGYSAKSARKIRQLWLWENSIKDETIAIATRKFPALTDLRFQGKLLTERTAKVLRQLPLDGLVIVEPSAEIQGSLHYVNSVKLLQLDRLASNDLSHLPTSITDFCCCGTTIDNEMFQQLSAYQSLKKIISRQAPVDQAAVDEFRKQRPDCHVDVD